MPDAGYPPEYMRAVEASSPTLVNLPLAVRAIDAPPQPPMQWLVRDLVPAGEIVIFAGDGGAFKSSATVHVGGAIAGGYPVFDAYPVARGPILIVSSEDSIGVVLMRLEAFCVGHDWDRTEVLSNVYILADGEPNFSDAAWRFHLIKEIERIRPAFVVLDPWVEVFGGDENSNTETRPVIKFFRSIAKNYGCAVGIVHHAGKASADKRTIDRIRGATALPHSSRAILFFEWLDDGVAVENLKMSRAPKLPRFIIKRTIEHEADNRGQWTSAKLAVEDAKQFTQGKAERFIVAQLRMSTVPLTSTDLRKLASGISGVSNEDVAKALTRLNAMNVLQYESGKQGAKLWRLTDRSWSGPREIQGNGMNGGRPFGNPADPIPATSANKVADLASRMPGQGWESAAPPKGGQPCQPPDSAPAGSNADIHEALEERRGIRES